MINAITVLETVLDNGADVLVDSNGMVNITGIGSIPASDITSIEKNPSVAEQIQKTRLTFTSENNATYTLNITGYSTSNGLEDSRQISWTSSGSNTTALTSAAITAAINALTGFSVSATDTSAGVVDLIGKTATTACPNAPIFTVREADSKCTVTAPLTVTFSAAPTGGRTATGYCVVSAAGALSSITITDAGEGYITAPTFTFAGSGEGSSAAATAILFEGRVVQVTVTGGTGYLNRIGLVAKGTYAALRTAYDYPSVSGASPYPVLSNLVSGHLYTEWIISYNEVVKGGNTTISSPVATKQVSILVYESATNVNTLNAYWGTLQNLRKGYKCTICDSGADNTAAITASTGATLLVAGGTPAFNNNTLPIKSNDILVVGTGVTPSAAGGGVGLVVTTTTALAGFIHAGFNNVATNVDAAVYKVVKRQPISQ